MVLGIPGSATAACILGMVDRRVRNVDLRYIFSNEL